MNGKRQLSERGVKHFLEEYNCAQSVLLTMFEHWGGKDELIPKIATGFGGGMGLCGSVCGALSGGVMVLGIRFGSNEPLAEKREKCYKLTEQLYKQFEKKHGTTLCRKLTGYDLTTSTGLEEARKAKVFDEKCPTYVRTVIENLVDLEKSMR